MARQIAVYLANNGETASLKEQGSIRIFKKVQGHWSIARELKLTLEQDLDLRELRKIMENIIKFLDECKVFVGLAITGVPYFALEKAGCSVWEFAGKPLDFLDYVLGQEENQEQLERQKAGSQDSKVIPLPVEVSPGCYKLSLKEVQQNNQGVTSKQVLLPFLRKSKFYSLEVLCDHVPPWLETELISGSLAGTIEKFGVNEVLVTIAKKSCNE